MDKPLTPHLQRKRAAMRAKILDTARAIMREEGAAALSMQELARRLDLRAPSLYHYFSSKMDLFDALFRLGLSLFEAHMSAVTRQEHTWQDEIRLSIEANLTFAMQNPELYQLCFERPVPGFTPSPESLETSFGMLQRMYARVAGFLPSLDTALSEQQVVDLVIALMHGLASLRLANEPGLPVNEGRFGPLVPAAVDLLSKAWAKT